MVNKNKISEIKIEQEDFKITIRSQDGTSKAINASAPIVTTQPAPVVQVVEQQATPSVVSNTPVAAVPQEVTSNLIEIKSPMIGTFYRAAGPDKEPFVAVGDSIEPGKVICMVEAMKLFNEIESEQSGKIVKILVEDATPVEFDQPLFLIEP